MEVPAVSKEPSANRDGIRQRNADSQADNPRDPEESTPARSDAVEGEERHEPSDEESYVQPGKRTPAGVVTDLEQILSILDDRRVDQEELERRLDDLERRREAVQELANKQKELLDSTQKMEDAEADVQSIESAHGR